VLGEWSFAFYLMHATVMYLALSLLGYQAVSWRNIVWYAPVFVVALSAAAALHHLIERPFEVRIRRWADERAKRRALTRSRLKSGQARPMTR
jgi:peptidoglycan/LPS O-acetylase OafA/YrhL